MREFIAEYEAEYGVITEEEMAEQARLDKEAAAEVRRRVQERIAAEQRMTEGPAAERQAG